MPPLRERDDDLPVLVNLFVKRFSKELGREIREVSDEVIALLRDYLWPGNIRELQSVLKQAILRSTGQVLLPSSLPELAAGASRTEDTSGSASSFDVTAFLRQQLQSGSNNIYEETHRLLDGHLLNQILEHTGGSQVQAAKLLGIARQTLRTKLRELNIQVTRSVEMDEQEDSADAAAQRPSA